MALNGTTGPTILFVPGLRDHVEDHWQTHAARAIAGSVTVPPLSADRLCRKARVAALDEALNAIDGPVTIVAHSAGCLTTAHWAAAPTRRVHAALLVTPADLEYPLPAGYPEMAELKAGGWLPIPRQLLPFRSIVVASRNDPLGSLDRVTHFADAWGSRVYHAGNVGHLNPAAGYGPWPQVVALLDVLDRTPADRAKA